MLSAHTQQSSKKVLTVLYLLSTYSTRFNILLYFIGHCSVIYTAEDVIVISNYAIQLSGCYVILLLINYLSNYLSISAIVRRRLLL